MKAFFYVQHLLGIGHLKRAATIAQALRATGFEVTLASGGAPVEGVPVLQLPPAASDASFRNLLDEYGKPVDEARFREVMSKSSFENMKESGYGDQINIGGPESNRSRFLRKGKVADWKNWFTVAQNDLFDERITRKLEAAGIHLDYEG